MATGMWGEHSLKTESAFKSGDVALRVKSVKDELWVSSRFGESETTGSEQNSDWSRWALKKKAESIRLVPLLPDKSVVVQPENSFRLRPGVEARIYVRVPLWLGIQLIDDKSQVLTEIPSATLSLTWFGSPFEGELCYWISSSARRDAISDPKRGHLAICPVQLKNSSDEDLLVEKICLRVKWLSLYSHERQLWANETKVTYRGGADMSQVSVSSGAPKEASEAVLVSHPRELIKKSFSMRTFFSWGSDTPKQGVEHD